MIEAITKKLDHIDKLWRVIYIVVSLIVAATVWATTLQIKVANLESRSTSADTRLSRIEFYVLRIAEKVGVQVEPPR